jgi:divalent metal cation (Fe/Co/Zn/Cd) transporter
MAMLSILTSLGTIALKFLAYFMTGSVGLLSDAMEALVNLAAALTALAALWVAEQPADSRHTVDGSGQQLRFTFLVSRFTFRVLHSP